MPLPKTDLMSALGTPPKPAAGGGPGGYLAGKPAQLRGYLMDAVDQSLTPEQRAEALCKAIENSGEPAEEPEEEAAPVSASSYEED